MIYEAALRRMGVKKIPVDPLAQARLFAKLNTKKAMVARNGNGSGKAKYRDRGLQIRTWGNKGEGY